jgi:hypothetical protein
MNIQGISLIKIYVDENNIKKIWHVSSNSFAARIMQKI